MSDQDLQSKWARYVRDRTEHLDRLLRQIHADGLESLSSAEREWLDRVSGEIGFELSMKDRA